MPDKGFIKKFLSLNDVSADASEVEIRSVLTRARWTREDIDAALVLLRDERSGSRVVAVKKHGSILFRPDTNLSSHTLSALLGVDVVVEPGYRRDTITHKVVKKEKRDQRTQYVGFVTIIALAIALMVGWGMSYVMNVGPYNVSIEWADI